MNVVFVCLTLGGGGAERVIQTLSNKLISLGVKVTIIALEDSNVAYGYSKDIKIIELKTAKLMKGVGKLFYIPLQAIELNRVLKTISNCSVMSFLVRANFTFIISSFFSKRKVIISERNHSQSQYKRKGVKGFIFRYLISKLYNMADIIVPISMGIEDSLRNDFNIRNPTFKTIYNPQDIKSIRSVKIRNDLVNNEYFNYITAGRLIEQKDHMTLLKSFSKVIKNAPKSRLYILGDGPLRGQLESYIKVNELEGYVFLLGFKQNAFEYFKQCDCFVFSSIFEGFGNVLVEAMACGLPIVSTSCPSGPSEILGDGQYGLLSDIYDVDALSHNMLIIQSDGCQSKFSELSKIRCEHFDIDLISSQYFEVLRVSLDREAA
ncbi:glycosyltransferase [Vibrio cincinnatiensis]|uniref:glycosyltransferase n=1 Tax=Vibrio cincinnatiensis TaxID=675 RepID=UPI001EDFD342|nr:glycosyltransferase [Vibrio cincinnatiensis]MCG3730700.1 glycosyltransferase [Vibrio cincinnatiensis]